MFKKLLLVFFSLLFIVISTAKNNSNLKKVKAYKTLQPIKLDGKLDEEVWKNTPVKDFTQKDPDEGKSGTEATSVWVAYDNKNIYIGAKMYDSQPALIDRSLMRRDEMAISDWFYVYLDTYNDNRNAYFFAVNAGGSIGDGTVFNDSWDDESWDGIWESKVSVDEKGWNCEIKIPLSQLRFKESENMTWGVNFNRNIKRKQEKQYFVMVPKNESGFASHFADLEGLKDIKPSQRIEFIPYIVQKAQYLIHDSNDPFYSGNQYKTTIGADLKIGIGSNLNLDVTLNPDFGQVEVDPAVVNLSAFETFYDEKRPFFIEGSNILSNFGRGGANNNWGFNFGDPNLFYSRRIGRSPGGDITEDYDFADRPKETRILGAAKLTGKLGNNWGIGVLSAFTQRTFAEVDTGSANYEQQIEPFTNYTVIRTQKQFDSGRHALGFILTGVNRELGDKELKKQMSKGSYTFGIDGWLALDKDDTYVIKGSLIGSYVHGTKEFMKTLQERSYRYFQRPDAENYKLDPNITSMSGWYSRIMLNKQKGNFYVNAALGAISPKFEYNDLGSQWMGDKMTGHLVLGYRWFKPDGLFRYKNLYISYNHSYDFDGNKLRRGFYATSFLRFVNYWSMGVSGGANLEKYSKFKTRGGPLVKTPTYYFFNTHVNSDRRKEFYTTVSFRSSGGDDKSYNYSVYTSLTWKPNSQIQISFGPRYSYQFEKTQWVGSFEDKFATRTYGKRYVFANMKRHTISGNIRVNWTFTPKLSLQFFLQPLFSVGEYDQFNELYAGSTKRYDTYGTNGSKISYNEKDDEYTVDPDGSGQASNFTFDNPNFNFKSFRANMVLRWEVNPGSILYLVWTHDQRNTENPGDFKFGRDFRNLWSAEADDIFLMKFTYWFDF